MQPLHGLPRENGLRLRPALHQRAPQGQSLPFCELRDPAGGPGGSELCPPPLGSEGTGRPPCPSAGRRVPAQALTPNTHTGAPSAPDPRLGVRSLRGGGGRPLTHLCRRLRGPPLPARALAGSPRSGALRHTRRTPVPPTPHACGERGLRGWAGLGGCVNSGPRLGLNAGGRPQPITWERGVHPRQTVGDGAALDPREEQPWGVWDGDGRRLSWGGPALHGGSACLSTAWGAGRLVDEAPGPSGRGAHCPGEPGSCWAAG